MKDKHLELIKYLDSCTEDAEAITKEIFSLRIELKTLIQKTRMMRQNLQAINRQLPAAPNESKLYNYSDCDWLS